MKRKQIIISRLLTEKKKEQTLTLLRVLKFIAILFERKVITTQITFTCWKSTIATLEKGVKCKVNNNTVEYVIEVVLLFLLLTWNVFHTFKQVNVSWLVGESFENKRSRFQNTICLTNKLSEAIFNNVVGLFFHFSVIRPRNTRVDLCCE